MKKLLLIFAVSLMAFGSLNAKTIWILDETDTHFSEFYNAFWENLKDTKFAPYVKYISRGETKIDLKPGDAVIQLGGLYLETTGEAVWTYNILMCLIDNSFNWNYRKLYMDAGTLVTQKEKASKAAEDVLAFLEKDFKVK
jgi:hypothetical protein